MSELSERDKHQFNEWIGILIRRHYKKGVMWKAKLRWKLVKEWNHHYAQAGIPGHTRRTLGEDGATKLFQEISEDIISNPDLLGVVISDTEDGSGTKLNASLNSEIDESLQKAAQHTLQQVNAAMAEKDSTEAAVKYLAITAAFLANPNTEYDKWFNDEFNAAVKSNGQFQLLCLAHIHGSVAGAVKRANSNMMMPEISTDVLQRTKEIYEKVMEIR
jgi:hypothetical protein